MIWLEMASLGADNTHMTKIDSSIAIEELDKSLIEKIENVKDPKFLSKQRNSMPTERSSQTKKTVQFKEWEGRWNNEGWNPRSQKSLE